MCPASASSVRRFGQGPEAAAPLAPAGAPSARGDRTGPLFAVVPGDMELDLKALAALSGDRKVETVPLKEVQPLTGYIRGGVTALAARKEFPVFVDETIELHEVVSISAGMRGLQLFLAPADYLRVTKARTGPIARTP